MSTTVYEFDGGRSVDIDARNDQDGDVVFVTTFSESLRGRVEDHAYALDRAEFIRAVCAEFGLIDPLEVLLSV
ncbi:hypothetical protein LK09_06090 [Microbacterium mangrovi]|uniref:Uncharacterized protein n=1 Tax=Microbacterium mangrovi TaxID=1348253 RepID=A0A0B2A9V8_9MICO|nr:hypothetical protein [Microbacterium mangrovi]KHK98543.1 hypothetical protein LK09_06090 [Microbacterium mangrovi]